MQVGKAKFPDGDHEDDNVCIVCWERVRKIVFCPCMHLVRSRISDIGAQLTA